MKVLVTGAGGFIGSHLVEELLRGGHEVRALVRYGSRGAQGWLTPHPSLEVRRGDVRDYDFVSSALEGMGMVFHLAALIGIPYSYVSPLAYVRTNVEGTYNVLQAAREQKVNRVVCTSTSEIYGTAQQVPISEGHPVNPQSPYGASKAGADHLAISFFRSFGLPVTLVRPFNTFGPRQSARAIIPSVIAQVLWGDGTLRLGSLTPTRDLNYVTDTVMGFLRVGLSDHTLGETVNLGTGKEISIGGLVGMIAALCGREVTILQEEARLRPEKSEVERLCADASKARRLTGWSPQTTLEDGLRKTISWIQENPSLYDPSVYAL